MVKTFRLTSLKSKCKNLEVVDFRVNFEIEDAQDREIEGIKNINISVSDMGNDKELITKNYKKFAEIIPKEYGTYNLIHRIDGQVIAVGVWDILPTSMSSVYLYYDPDFSFLNLGVFTAIREIEYMKYFCQMIDPNFKYYVLGFYIDTCQKMKYKGDYHPLEILDPFTYNFVKLDEYR